MKSTASEPGLTATTENQLNFNPIQTALKKVE